MKSSNQMVHFISNNVLDTQVCKDVTESCSKLPYQSLTDDHALLVLLKFI